MTSLLGKIFGGPAEAPVPCRGDMAYAAAMMETDEVLKHMRESAESTDAARAVMADVWAQNRNIPFLTTVIEAVEEAKSPLEQRPDDLTT